MLKYWVVERISSLRLSLLKVEKSWATSSDFDGGIWVLLIKSFMTVAVAENYMYRCLIFHM